MIVFWSCVLCGVLSVGWSWVVYASTSACFSDLANYGIDYKSGPYNEIVAIAKSQVLWSCAPLGVVLLLSLVIWGIGEARNR